MFASKDMFNKKLLLVSYVMICADTLIFSHFTCSPSLGIAVLWLLTQVPTSVSFSLSDLTSNVSFLTAGKLEVPSNVFKTSERAC